MILNQFPVNLNDLVLISQFLTLTVGFAEGLNEGKMNFCFHDGDTIFS